MSIHGTDGWIPICEKTTPYELTVSLLLTAKAPGVPHPIKLQEQHKQLFPLDQPISEASGSRLAQWAAGGAVNWTREIQATATLDALVAVWGRVPVSERKRLASVKDARKAELTAPPADEPDPVTGEVATPPEDDVPFPPEVGQAQE